MVTAPAAAVILSADLLVTPKLPGGPVRFLFFSFFMELLSEDLAWYSQAPE
jgi:hypothetical protein